jgi:hypothetical protein
VEIAQQGIDDRVRRAPFGFHAQMGPRVEGLARRQQRPRRADWIRAAVEQNNVDDGLVGLTSFPLSVPKEALTP